MKNEIKGKKGKRKLFTLENKRAYIALLILAVLVSISVTARRQALKASEKQTAFDDESWRAAVAESGVDVPERQEEEAAAKAEAAEKNNAKETSEKPEKKPEEKKSQAEAAPAVAVAWETPETEAEAVQTAAQETQSFIRPSKGSVLKDYSGDELVYSETMEDWRTHNGIDFAAETGDQVVAACSGTVKKVYKDDMLGITVEIEHANGVVSRYSGLQSLDFITEGKKVNTGDIIGGVGASGALEQETRSHLHFEIVRNGEYENPNLYFAK